MTIEEVRGMKKSLEKYQGNNIEFIPMFTHMLLDMLNAYEGEIDRLNLHINSREEEISVLCKEIKSLNNQRGY